MIRTKQLLSSSEPNNRVQIFNAVCKDAAENLDADLTSVWTFDSELSQIECQCRYDAIEDSFSNGQVLKQSDYPIYFQTIVEDSLVNAPEARTLRTTKEFTESYFIPLGIHSLLDFTLHNKLTPIGVICCENRRDIRHWSKQDEEYLRSIAVLTAFLFTPLIS